jgi:hypothetical protein
MPRACPVGIHSSSQLGSLMCGTDCAPSAHQAAEPRETQGSNLYRCQWHEAATSCALMLSSLKPPNPRKLDLSATDIEASILDSRRAILEASRPTAYSGANSLSSSSPIGECKRRRRTASVVRHSLQKTQRNSKSTFPANEQDPVA